MPPPLRRGFAKLRNIGDRDNTSRVSSDVGGARYDSLFGQSFLFVVATLLVDPSFSLVVPSHDNFHRVKEGLLEENEKEREREIRSAPFGERTTLHSLWNTSRGTVAQSDVALSREGMTELTES